MSKDTVTPLTKRSFKFHLVLTVTDYLIYVAHLFQESIFVY